MRKDSRRTQDLKVAVAGLAALLVAGVGAARWIPQTDATVQTPSTVRISSERFGVLIDRLSEPEGYFDTDNFISNESSYLHVVPRLRNQVRPGGVYLGVGPDQNFSYIVHSEPSLAIITDIRRQNMLEHLLFKVLIEQAETRAEFLCLLLSKDCNEIPVGLDFGELLDRVQLAQRDAAFLDETLVAVGRTLLEGYGLRLSEMDLKRIEYVHRSFAEAGLDLRFSTLGRPSSNYPTFREVLLETDLEGRQQSYLASEESYRWLRQFQLENRLIPIVGDFAGDEALREVASFLEEEGLSVSVFYTSNVEFYLFGRPGWLDYLDNVRAFSFSDDAVFIRSYFPTYGVPHPQNVRGHRSTSLIQPIAGFLEDLTSGRLLSYWDVVARHNL